MSPNSPPKMPPASSGPAASDVFVRRLRAVAAIDVVGYAKLMSLEESRTHARVNALFAELVSPAIKEHHGQQIERAGDGLLVLFESSTDAVRCALVIQQSVEQHQASIEVQRQLRLRIGINVGDIIFDGEEIAGDDVNIAVRLQGLAEPGAVCISGSVRAQLHEELDGSFEDLGEVSLKNIERPVRAFQVRRGGVGVFLGHRHWTRWLPGSSPGRKQWRLISMVAGFFLLLAAIGWWQWPAPSVEGPPPMSVAILPLKSSSNGLGGSSEEVMARLVRALMATGWLDIRDSALVTQVASQISDLSELRELLNVRYVVQGQIAAMEGKMTVDAQLVDTQTRSAVWTTRLQVPDGPDAPAALSGKLLVPLRVAIHTAETKRLFESGAAPRTAMEHKMLGDFERRRLYALDSEIRSRPHYQRSLESDPNFVQSMISLAYTYLLEIDLAAKPDVKTLIDRADELSKDALARSWESAPAWQLRSEVLSRQWSWPAALDANDRALSIDPARAWGYGQRASLMVRMGRPSEALPLTDRALALAEQRWGTVLFQRCRALLALGDYRGALEACQKSISYEEWWLQRAYLVAAHALLNEPEKATQERTRLYRELPGASVSRVLALAESDLPEFRQQLDMHLLKGLRLAGVPEGD